MVTKLFTSVGIDVDFKEDLHQLMGIPQEVVKDCIKALPYMASSDGRSKYNEIIGGIVTKHKTSELAIRSALAVLFFFANALNDDDYIDDSVEDWGKDLVEKEFLDEPRLLLFIEYVNKIKKDVSEQFQTSIAIKRCSRGVLPSFSAVGTTTGLRSVSKVSFDHAKHLKEYLPKIEGLVPIISINVETDDDSNFSFQATESQLKELIATLQASLTEVKKLKETYPTLKVYNI